jgi:hypothetical protein
MLGLILHSFSIKNVCIVVKEQSTVMPWLFHQRNKAQSNQAWKHHTKQFPFHFGEVSCDLHRIVIAQIPEVLFVYITGQVEVGLI